MEKRNRIFEEIKLKPDEQKLMNGFMDEILSAASRTDIPSYTELRDFPERFYHDPNGPIPFRRHSQI